MALFLIVRVTQKYIPELNTVFFKRKKKGMKCHTAGKC